MKRKLLFPKIFVFVLAMLITSMSFVVTAQTVVKIPISAVTTTASFHKHVYVPAPGFYKEIWYFVVISPSSGGIRVAFDACDVCWAAYKGYMQVGANMRCNNCGNTYGIEGLGTSNTGGGCWPGFLPRTVDATDVIINISDIEGGAHYFELKSGTVGIEDNDNLDFSYFQHDNVLKLEMGTEAKREIKLMNLIGQTLYSTNNSSSEVLINTSELAPRIYILYIEEDGKVFAEKIYIH